MLRARGFLIVGLLGATVAATAASAPGASSTAGSAAAVKPVIGRPAAVPAQPTAGRRFTVSFAVKRSDTGRPLRTGRLKADPSVAGKLVPHTESFRGGVARVSLVVPASGAGKALKVKVVVTAAGGSATRVASYRVAQRSQRPSLTIDDADVSEGSSGATTLSFAVRLSARSAQPVSVTYETADGTAAAASDYSRASGTLAFAPGETEKQISIGIVADTAIEQDETFVVALSNAVGATIDVPTATGTIRNDDTAVAVTPGSYRGATQDGNYVFLTVLPNRTLTGFRVNDLPERCDGPISLRGGVDWTDSTFTIRTDASFLATGNWTGSVVRGDAEYTAWSARLTGQFSGNSVSGTVVVSDELKYKGTPYKCTTGEVRWSATLQP